MLASKYAPHLHEVGAPILRQVDAIGKLQAERARLFAEAEQYLLQIAIDEQKLARAIASQWSAKEIKAATAAAAKS
jgi:hypothetical protein